MQRFKYHLIWYRKIAKESRSRYHWLFSHCEIVFQIICRILDALWYLRHFGRPRAGRNNSVLDHNLGLYIVGTFRFRTNFPGTTGPTIALCKPFIGSLLSLLPPHHGHFDLRVSRRETRSLSIHVIRYNTIRV